MAQNISAKYEWKKRKNGDMRNGGRVKVVNGNW